MTGFPQKIGALTRSVCDHTILPKSSKASKYRLSHLHSHEEDIAESFRLETNQQASHWIKLNLKS